MSGEVGTTVLCRFLDEIDIHILWMLVFLSPGSLALGWFGLLGTVWWVLPIVLLPQGRILTRAFLDFPAFGRRPWWYLASNEFVVFGTTAAIVAAWLAKGRI